MNRNFSFLNSFLNVSEETFLELEKITEFKRIKAGTQLVKLNEVPSKIYMLVSGIIRCYLTTEDGKEYNKSFYLPTSFVASLTALLKNKPSQMVFETLSDCKIYEIDYRELMALSQRDRAINNLYSKVLEFVYIKYERRLVELMSLDAKDRYLALKEQIPNVDDIIPQYQIASYLGITAVQLSRIRKKMDSY
ncbi:Crp/Fnr family transcriptional regulator [Seonamhaeicola sp.]|uniref:Crp/Fnr family transcriptional regulator n=1 Tax=Seonamhaeicola sp. TaxID=1912245 RepID=UPI002613D234|nr:Crp/Fnr family transcriptional regulator [Seonamhaeicola sp.]